MQPTRKTAPNTFVVRNFGEVVQGKIKERVKDCVLQVDKLRVLVQGGNPKKTLLQLALSKRGVGVKSRGPCINLTFDRKTFA